MGAGRELIGYGRYIPATEPVLFEMITNIHWDYTTCRVIHECILADRKETDHEAEKKEASCQKAPKVNML